MYWKWNNPDAGTADGAMTQWVTIDPRNASHLYLDIRRRGVWVARQGRHMATAGAWKWLFSPIRIPNMGRTRTVCGFIRSDQIGSTHTATAGSTD